MTSQLYGQNEVLIWVFLFLMGAQGEGERKVDHPRRAQLVKF